MEINKEVIDVIDTNNFKDALLASLYSQVEYLRDELHETNTHIRTLLSIIKDRKPLYEDVAHHTKSENKSKCDMDNNKCDDANEIIDLHTPMDESKHNDIRNSTTLNDISTLVTSIEFPSNESIDFEENKSFSLIQQLQEIRAVKHLEYNDKLANRRVKNVNVSEENYNISKNNNRFTWEKHSSGIASKIMGKMGYKGKGSGKAEDGILEPIKIENTKEIGGKRKKEGYKRMAICILSDSMFNQIDEKRLSSKHDVKVLCHGGCTIECMYSHVPLALQLNPKYIVLNVSTNDSVRKTSDEMLRELSNLKRHIEKALPSCEVIISLPTVRTDDKKANQILKNLIMKLKRSKHRLLDNTNIKAYHLGKKGLHLNNFGTRKLASNIISLIKRL